MSTMTYAYLVDIAIVRSNSMIYDTRVIKILSSLHKRYDLLVLGWDRKGIYKFDYLKKEINWKSDDKSKTYIKVLSVRAPFNRESLISYTPMIFYFPIFWMWVLLNLFKSRPKIVYACDLDTIRKKPKHSVIIMNCPKDYAIKKEESKDDHLLRIVYTGAIWRKTRGLENIIAAIRDLTGVEFVMAGWYRGKDKEFLDQILQISNVKFRGLLEPNDALALEASSDVMIALYEPELLLYSVTLPNKLFEAMMCGVPLITNVASEVVNQVGSGIIVK